MLKWFDKNAKALQALAAMGSILLAVAALIGIKIQIDASARQQQEQSARDIYREFLALSINQPKYASPDYCEIEGSADEAGYDHYVQYMLYASEQILATRADWVPTMSEHLAEHKELFCSEADWMGDTPQVQSLIKSFRAKNCVGFKSACLPK